MGWYQNWRVLDHKKIQIPDPTPDRKSGTGCAGSGQEEGGVGEVGEVSEEDGARSVKGGGGDGRELPGLSMDPVHYGSGVYPLRIYIILST